MKVRSMRHKGGHRDSGGGVQLGLIITPMLDMSFQLMAFFIMTFHPSALEGHIDGNLLPPKEIAQRSKTPVPTPTDLPAVDDEPALQDVLLVIVKAVGKGQTEGQRVDGEPTRIMLQRPENTEAATISDSDSTIAEGLRRLTAELKKETGPKANIKIEGDGDLKHQFLMQVYDACKQAGYKNISFVAPARERPG
jgi:biopolymer transport protein ExbD